VAKIKLLTVNHVGVPIKDRRVSLKFYRDLLGLRVIPSMVDAKNIVWMRTDDGTMVHLIEPAEGRPPHLPTPGAAHVAYHVADFDGALATLKEAGHEVEGPGERHDGQRHMFVKDPDGNRVELVSIGWKQSGRVADELGYTREA
jgi:catechol 2,3-dioxygenase-like lactoylglutathione lyase family enzyme